MSQVAKEKKYRTNFQIPTTQPLMVVKTSQFFFAKAFFSSNHPNYKPLRCIFIGIFGTQLCGGLGSLHLSLTVKNQHPTSLPPCHPAIQIKNKNCTQSQEPPSRHPAIFAHMIEKVDKNILAAYTGKSSHLALHQYQTLLSSRTINLCDCIS